MICECCGKSPANDGVNLERTNPLGEIGRWKCWECLTDAERKNIDPVVLGIDDALNKHKNGGGD